MQHFRFLELVNWRIRGLVFWCHEQVTYVLLCHKIFYDNNQFRNYESWFFADVLTNQIVYDEKKTHSNWGAFNNYGDKILPNFDPLFPRVEYCGQFTSYIPFVTWPRNYWMPPWSKNSLIFRFISDKYKHPDWFCDQTDYIIT